MQHGFQNKDHLNYLPKCLERLIDECRDRIKCEYEVDGETADFSKYYDKERLKAEVLGRINSELDQFI